MSRFTDLLGDYGAEKRFLAILEPYDPSTGAVRPIYLSTHAFVTQPADTPSNQYFEARLNRPYSFSRSLFSSGKLSGRSLPSAGAIVLNNGDGGLDELSTYAWGGRRVRVYLGGENFALKVQPLGTENGDTITIMHPRYGLSAGRALRAIDVTFDMDDYEVELGLWG